jgi:hypothetical protein
MGLNEEKNWPALSSYPSLPSLSSLSLKPSDLPFDLLPSLFLA